VDVVVGSSMEVVGVVRVFFVFSNNNGFNLISSVISGLGGYGNSLVCGISTESVVNKRGSLLDGFSESGVLFFDSRGNVLGFSSLFFHVFEDS